MLGLKANWVFVFSFGPTFWAGGTWTRPNASETAEKAHFRHLLFPFFPSGFCATSKASSRSIWVLLRLKLPFRGSKVGELTRGREGGDKRGRRKIYVSLESEWPSFCVLTRENTKIFFIFIFVTFAYRRQNKEAPYFDSRTHQFHEKSIYINSKCSEMNA